ncbi:hypothetical protein C8R47DRAFT_1134261 [Mycena vitilis]|nr:hypothetical protein C8R47DRAFT_1134261 [Mycena vitilis]
MQSYTLEDADDDERLITVMVTSATSRLPVSTICPTLGNRRWLKIYRAMIAARERTINYDNTESPWDAPWRHVGDWIGFYPGTDMFSQKKIWDNQYRRVGYQPTKTIAAPATKHTKIQIPDLTAVQLISLDSPSGEGVWWLHVHGFIELKRALSRKRSLTLDGIPLTFDVLRQLRLRLRLAAEQVERQAALHFRQLHNRLHDKPDVIDHLPHKFYVIATTGHWFTIGFGSDPFYHASPAVVAQAEGMAYAFWEEAEVEEEQENEDDAPDAPNPVLPAWSLEQLTHEFESQIAVQWAPQIHHLNDPKAWQVLDRVRNLIKDDLKDIKDSILLIPDPMVA